MRKNKLLLSGLLAIALVVTGCSKETIKIPNGSNPVGVAGDKETILKLQELYEYLKTNAGGSETLDVLIKQIAMFEYDEYIRGTKTYTGETFNVKSYRNLDGLKEDITEVFENVIDSGSYNDPITNEFDEDLYVESLEDAGYTVDTASTTPSSYLDIDELTYNYDAYIEEVVMKDVYVNYMYEDYLLGITTPRIKVQFQNQYPIEAEVLKFDYYTDAQNRDFSEALRLDVSAVLTGANKETGFTFNKNGYGFYSFTTSNSKGNLINFTASANVLIYVEYESNEKIEALLEDVYNRDVNSLREATTRVAEAIDGATEVVRYTVNNTTEPTVEFFKAVEAINIARKLYIIDSEVEMARNFDLKNEAYEKYTETKKDNAESFASTYSNSGSQSIKDGAVNSKEDREDEEYYLESEVYTKTALANVVPSAISALRGTSTRDVKVNVSTFAGNDYLLPKKDGLESPIYKDSSYYYVCKVNYVYGLYESANITQTDAAYRQVTDYHIDAYQTGEYSTYKYESATNRFVVDREGLPTVENKQIVDMIQKTASAIVNSTYRTDALVAMFEKYELSIHDQEIYDYISNQYPAYFEED